MSDPSQSGQRRSSRRGLLRGLGLGLVAGGAVTRTSARGSAEPSFFVRSIQPEEPTVETGEPFDVSGRIVNLGTPGTSTVEYRIDEVTRQSEQVTLNAAEERTVTFEGIATEDLGAGSYTHGFYADNTGTQGTLTVQNVPVFEVTELDPRLGGASPGGTLDVTAMVTNTGEGSGTQRVRLLLDGEEVDARPVELSPGESREVSLAATVPDREGEYTQAVETDDDRTTGAVSVAASDGDSGTGVGASPALLLALGGGVALTLYGAYAYLGRGSPDEQNAEAVPGVPAEATGAGGSTVVAGVIDGNIEDCDTALSEAESELDRGNDDAALGACDRARSAAMRARDAAESYDPDRLAAIESRLERVRRLETEVEDDSDR